MVDMDVFIALAEPTRRTIVELLAERGAMPAMEIGKKFHASPPAISQHLKVLREAKIVTMKKSGRERIYSVNPSAMKAMAEWAHRTQAMWDKRFDAFANVLQAVQEEKNSKEKNKKRN